MSEKGVASAKAGKEDWSTDSQDSDDSMRDYLDEENWLNNDGRQFEEEGPTHLFQQANITLKVLQVLQQEILLPGAEICMDEVSSVISGIEVLDLMESDDEITHEIQQLGLSLESRCYPLRPQMFLPELEQHPEESMLNNDDTNSSFEETSNEPSPTSDFIIHCPELNDLLDGSFVEGKQAVENGDDPDDPEDDDDEEEAEYEDDDEEDDDEEEEEEEEEDDEDDDDDEDDEEEGNDDDDDYDDDDDAGEEDGNGDGDVENSSADSNDKLANSPQADWDKEPKACNPPDLELGDLAADIKFHPTENVICIGGFSGAIYVGRFDSDVSEVINKNLIHQRAIRAIAFSDKGNEIISIAKDKSILITDLETCTPVNSYTSVHEHFPTEIKVINHYLLATGDEEGYIKLWDMRRPQPLFGFSAAEDFISSIISGPEKNYLASTSLDGTINVMDLRKRQACFRSEHNSELTSSDIFRSGTRLVIGTSTGLLLMYDWGRFNSSCETFNLNIKERYYRQINKVTKAREDMAMVAWEDGKIRAVQLYPHKKLGIVGQQSISIDVLAVSPEGEYAVSSAFEEPIKFWDISYLNENAGTMPTRNNLLGSGEYNLPSSSLANPRAFYFGLE